MTLVMAWLENRVTFVANASVPDPWRAYYIFSDLVSFVASINAARNHPHLCQFCLVINL